MKVAVVDYGMGNIGSILNMLRKVGANAYATSTAEGIEEADRIILPGVGAFDNGMANLRQRGLREILQEAVISNKKPILGICLGMQLFSRRSDEGELPGFGWIAADAVKFSFMENTGKLRIPHMGWNSVEIKKPGGLFLGMHSDPRFYFVHTYHVRCDAESDILAETRYGYNFVSAVQRDNIFGVQFHPEKSHKYGMCLIRNFVRDI